MAPDTLIMVVLICVGGALIIAGLIYVAIAVVRLAKAARKAGIDSMDKVRILMRKVQGLGPRVAEMQRKEEALAKTLSSLSASTSKLTYLRDEFDRATGNMTHLK